MPHNVFGKKLNRDTGQRQALLKGLAGALIRSQAIETTEAKAKAALPLIEKLIVQARRARLNDIRQIEGVILDKDLIQKLVHEIAPRLKDKAGGFLRLIKLGNRVGDNAPMVRMEFTFSSPAAVASEPQKTKSKAKISSRKPAAKTSKP